MNSNNTGRDFYHRIPFSKKQLVKSLLFFVENLGPVIIYLMLSHFFDTKIAIFGTVVFGVLDIARRLWFGAEIPKLYWITSGLTVGFGTVDFFSQTPFMLRFEPVISSLVVAVVFVAGAGGKVSLIQEIVEKKRGEAFTNRPDLQRFFMIITLAWAVFFFVRAALYLWAALAVSLDKFMEIRMVFGTASLGVMIVLTMTLARRFYSWLYRRGLLPSRPADSQS